MMNHYLATPTTETHGGVLVLHAWWGLNQFIKDFCDRLAEEGFLAVAPDIYNGKVANKIEDAERLRSSLKRKEVEEEIIRAAEFIRAQFATLARPSGLIGFSLGAYTGHSGWSSKSQTKSLRRLIFTVHRAEYI